MQSSGMKEKRTYPRNVLYSEVIATCALGEARKLLSINCSNSGIGLISFTPIEVGEVFELEFTMNEDNDTSKYKLSAEVVQSHNVRDIYVLGLRFQEELDIYSENQAS